MARSKMFTIRVDEAEHALFKGAAAGVGISISEYARDAMLARMALEDAPIVPPVLVVPTVIQSKEDVRAAVEAFGPLVSRPADVSAAVERVVSVSPQARAFTPFSKEEQAGKVRSSKPVGKPETCRHGLLRCKVCGTG